VTHKTIIETKLIFETEISLSQSCEPFFKILPQSYLWNW